MKYTCAVSGKSFEVTDADQKFYARIDVPPPKLCPTERERRRLAWRGNQFFLRPCDRCGQRAFSCLAPELKMQAVCNECFQSEDFDMMEHGREFDFSRPFFDQFAELQQVVPRHTANAVLNENSEYIICAHRNKNCYLADEIDESRDCVIGYNLQHCVDIHESLYVRDSEVGYQLLKAENCYAVFFSMNVHHCSDSAFLQNCRSCKKCLFCDGLRGQEYHVFNQKVTPEVYEKYWHFLFTGSRKNLDECRSQWEKFLSQREPMPPVMIQTENCSGNFITNSQNCHDCTGIDNCRDCKFCRDVHFCRDCYDLNIYEGELLYEGLHIGPKGYRNLFSMLCWFSSDIEYCVEMHHCHNCFGGAGLKKKSNVIFNRAYSQHEFETLRAKIIDHMRETDEWGEFFPIAMSPTPYNHTMAQQFFPIDQMDAAGYGATWLETPDPITASVTATVPELLSDASDTLLQQVFSCGESGKKFRVTAVELAFARRWNLPLSEVSPKARLDRLWKELEKISR